MIDALRTVVERNTAGSPTTPGLKWTHLSITEVAARLLRRGFEVSRKVVKRLLRSLGFKKRRLVKSVTKAPSRDRDEQFTRIAQRRREFRERGDPILSVDSKRKQWLGPMYRSGTVFANGPAAVLDHDLPSYADGQVIPHGIYDVTRNTAHLNLNTGRDTAAFAAASLRWYWEHVVLEHSPDADRVLLLSDCGGSNDIRSREYRYRLWEWAEACGVTIEAAHLPVYCSKYNPIERRVFPHVEQAWSGRTFETVEEVAAATREVTTEPGLTTTAHVIAEHYTPIRRRGKPLPERCRDQITHDEDLPEYNYTITPAKPPQLSIPRSTRTIDVDLVLFDESELEVDHRTIPDPDILVRPFFAIPLAEIAPDDRIPGHDQTLRAVAAMLDGTTVRRRDDVAMNG